MAYNWIAKNQTALDIYLDLLNHDKNLYKGVTILIVNNLKDFVSVV